MLKEGRRKKWLSRHLLCHHNPSYGKNAKNLKQGEGALSQTGVSREGLLGVPISRLNILLLVAAAEL
jgi:hypothetical protein